MTGHVTLFSLFGFKVKLHGSWLFLALLVAWSLAMGYFPAIESDLTAATYWVMGLVGVVGLFFSIVIHEFCHSLAARVFRIPMRGITLFIFGGIAEMEEEPPSPKAEGLMAVAGPVASVVLWGLFGLLAGWGLSQGWESPVTMTLAYLSQINLVLAVFNMIPAFPLDGGRVLRSILWAVKGDIRWATQWAAGFGSAFGTLLILFGVVGIFAGQWLAAVWWILIGFFIQRTAKISKTQLLVKEALQHEPLSRFILTNPPRLLPEHTVQFAVDRFFYRLREKVFPVVEDDKLIGCLDTRQIRGVPEVKREQTPVRAVMSVCAEKDLIDAEESAYRALKKMGAGNVKQLFVVREDGYLVGSVRRNDLVEFVSVKLEIEGDDFQSAA